MTRIARSISPRLRSLAPVAAMAVVALVAACAGGEPPAFPPDTAAQPASNAPGVFVLAPGASLEPLSCRTPLLDPRRDIELRMVRSQGARRADYEVVPAGSYGVGTEELLRIDCQSLEPIGIVPR